MAGCDVAWQMNASLPIVIVAGMITGCAGGVLRDILCNDVPLLFRAELYASVSVVTGLFYASAFGFNVNHEFWTALTFAFGSDAAFAGDPLQMGNAEIRLRRRSALSGDAVLSGLPAFATCSAVTTGAALPQALRM